MRGGGRSKRDTETKGERGRGGDEKATEMEMEPTRHKTDFPLDHTSAR